ncbi:MAG: lipid IV(A) 3-deoxy-D-manno-octulosonic acid transferase [Methylotenera sp.]|nr:lipid IV(A) 3-deoxy-D-manno-octulosonic acid transferase [Methylotenera sp.]
MTRNVYTFLLYLLLPFTPLKLLWRAKKQPEYLQHWRERYGFYAPQFTKPVIWLHCVSVGETRAAEPLIKLLLHKYPNHQILLTHTTPTGRATSEQLFGDLVARVYLPYDLPFAVERFLKHFRPAVGVLMETELWFNLIANCKQYAIPLLLVNARLSEKSALGYGKLGAVVQQGLQSLSAVGAQTSQDAERLKNLGAHNVSIMGNLKFDVTPQDGAVTQGQLLRDRLGENRPIFLAASTREGEEVLIIDAVTKANIPNLLTIIVPRHPQRFEEVAELLKKHSANFTRRSTLANQTVAQSQLNYLLGDSMGEMFTYYAACDVAFIGGSLLPLGGQNLIEAFSLGKPVLIGPHTFNFAQVAELAIAAGAAQRVQNTSELANSIKALFADFAKRQTMSDAALSFSAQSRGATQRTLSLIEQHLRA